MFNNCMQNTVAINQEKHNDCEIINNKYQRDTTFDIIRGIGIVLMVIGHIGYPLNSFIYLFHMALFFIISGYFFSNKCYQTISDVKKFIIRKIKTLYIPFISWNILLVLFHNFLISINVYSTTETTYFRDVSFAPTHFYTITEIIKKIIFSLLFYHQEKFGGATWFLRVLFFVSIFSCIFYYIVQKYVSEKNRDYVITSIYTLACLIGYGFLKLHFNFYSIGTMFSVAFLFYLGIIIKKKNINFKNVYVNSCIFISSIVVLWISSLNNIKIELSANCYPNPLLLVLLSFCGFIFIKYIATCIVKFKLISDLFIFLGQNTLYLLLYNTIGFKIFTYLQIKLFNYPIVLMSSYPVIVNNIHKVWLFYLFSSIIGAFILKYAFQSILFLFELIIKKIFIKECK